MSNLQPTQQQTMAYQPQQQTYHSQELPFLNSIQRPSFQPMQGAPVQQRPQGKGLQNQGQPQMMHPLVGMLRGMGAPQQQGNAK